jgi:hypothetical protein
MNPKQAKLKMLVALVVAISSWWLVPNIIECYKNLGRNGMAIDKTRWFDRWNGRRYFTR